MIQMMEKLGARLEEKQKAGKANIGETLREDKERQKAE
jgi:hypothetical protein